VVFTLLWQRGIKTDEEISEFLNPQYGSAKYDPFQFKEMTKVVERLLTAAQKLERILIYGDYDADGVCSSVLMVETLERLLCKNIQVYLPHRDSEGYGLNPKTVEYIKSQKINLVITCDCGTTNIPELTNLKTAGIDVIVIDHHVAPEQRPPVYGFINPKYQKDSYPFRNLAACGVILKVVQGLRKYLGDKRGCITEAFEKWCLDLTAIATVADVMPLLGENRILVKWGLVVLNKTKRLGLRALLKAAGLLSADHQQRLPKDVQRPREEIEEQGPPAKKIDTYDIGYIIAPRLNAAGRLDHANVAFDLLRGQDEKIAHREAETLNKTNQTRQALTETIFAAAKKQVKEQLDNHDRLLVAYNLEKDSWPVGVIGLVAGKLAKEFYRPSIVITNTAHGPCGSGRSIDTCNIITVLEQTKDLFSKYGGHPQACGFSFETAKTAEYTITSFKKRAEEFLKKTLSDDDLQPRITASSELLLTDLTWDLVKDLQLLEPYGKNNCLPEFLTRQVKIESLRTIGAQRAHLKMALQQSGVFKSAVAFYGAEKFKHLKHGDEVDIIYTLSINEWNNTRSIQLNIKDLIL
jgi:single-stranded-DNA-specific exonuclease